MGLTMTDLGIDRLSSAERVELALEIWESLGENRPTLPISDELHTELLRRDAEMDADPGIGLTWAQIRAHAEGAR